MMASARENRPQLRLAVRNPARPLAATAEIAARRPEPSLDDAQLLSALRAGDASAATALHDRARPIVDRTLARLLGRFDRDAEDVVQAALIEIVMGIDRFRGDCPLDAWCSTVTAHVIYKHLRRRQTERRIFEAVELTDDGARPLHAVHEPRSTHDVARESLLRSAVARVRAHLGAMETQKAWAFVLHDVFGYDLREIAQITGATVAAAQTRLTRGRRELHERIGGDPELADRLTDLGGEP
jgi:RNA polymerase sigma-70 factor (ECF subfamily)